MSRTTFAASLAAAALLAGGGYGVAQAATPHQSGAAATGHHSMTGMRGMQGMHMGHQVVSHRAGAVISIKNFTYHVPASVRHGAIVTVVNRDSTTHTVTKNGGGFSVIVKAHKSRTFRAPGKGTYRFHCNFHSSMHGTLHVR